MSTGIVVCSVCHHEVHQNGPDIEVTGIRGDVYKKGTWTHCAGGPMTPGTPICSNAHPEYPTERPIGMYCGADG